MRTEVSEMGRDARTEYEARCHGRTMFVSIFSTSKLDGIALCISALCFLGPYLL